MLLNDQLVRMMKVDIFGNLGSCIAGLFFIWATYQQIFPDYIKIAIKEFLLLPIQKLSFFSNHFINLFSPYVEINFPQFQESTFNHAYTTINLYLGSKVNDKAKILRASQMRDSKVLDLKRDETTFNDEYKGFKLWWKLVIGVDGNKSYQLTFHNRARSVVTGSYIPHVVNQGKLIEEMKNKKIKIFTNLPRWDTRYHQRMWRVDEFEHPSSFQTLAMDPKKKEEILNDLVAFTNGKEYYKKIGKVWKRGYLLYGPSGTGKSTMIAAMANLINYNIFDLKLANIQNNSDLMALLTTIGKKVIIVVEDIDCYSYLMEKSEENGIHKSSITLFGLLNFIDGLCSTHMEQRIMVITTKHLRKLDPSLTRSGRMDMCIEFHFCTYEAFKILAKNYLDLDDHPLFEEIKFLLEETNISPADVAEILMIARSPTINIDECLDTLIQSLERRYRYLNRQNIEHKEPKKHKLFRIFGSSCFA